MIYQPQMALRQLRWYRPLPLAGVVFSQPSAGAERSVQHHWGMDKRWDLLPESVGMLPTALRPVKPGIPWRRVLASAAALTMVSWAVWMSIAYVTNRNQIAGANAQASLAARENQSLEQRLHALSELQKTRLVFSIALSMACHGMNVLG